MTISTSLYSQVTAFGKKFSKGQMIQVKGADQFQGKYVWKSGADNFTLVLKKEIIKASSDNPIELIAGTYDYSKNGKIIYPSSKNPGKYGNIAGIEVINGKLNIDFLDATTGARAKGYIAFNNDGKLIWKIAQHDGEGIRFKGHRKDLSVPTDMILEKVSN